MIRPLGYTAIGGGYLYKFNPASGMIDKIAANYKGRLRGREGAVHNFNEWIKFSTYAERYL